MGIGIAGCGNRGDAVTTAGGGIGRGGSGTSSTGKGVSVGTRSSGIGQRAIQATTKSSPWSNTETSRQTQGSASCGKMPDLSVGRVIVVDNRPAHPGGRRVSSSEPDSQREAGIVIPLRRRLEKAAMSLVDANRADVFPIKEVVDAGKGCQFHGLKIQRVSQAQV